MTAETLKPFITPQNVDNFTATHSTTTRRQHSTNFLAIGLSVTAAILALALLGITIWHTLEINKLNTEVKNVRTTLENLQKRLGIPIMDEFSDFERQYNNALIDDPNTLIDDEDDEDEDLDEDDNDNYDVLSAHKGTTRLSSEEIDYDEIVDKLNTYEDDDDEDDEDDDEEDEEINASDDDDFYTDFEKFKDSKKKKESTRATRSITTASNGIDKTTASLQKTEESPLTKLNKSEFTQEQVEAHEVDQKKSYRSHPRSSDHFVSERKRKPHLLDAAVQHKPRGYRKRKVALIKKGESPLLSAKSLRQVNTKRFVPAAHFHLNHKVPNRSAAINVQSYTGDMYIGHPSWSNEISSEQYFTVENGILTVHEPGLYYVYAQVCYNNTHDQNGFVIFHGHKPFLQCLNTVPTNIPTKIHTCHTSGIINIKEEETIHLRDFHSDRSVILKDANNRSYFGLIKI